MTKTLVIAGAEELWQREGKRLDRRDESNNYVWAGQIADEHGHNRDRRNYVVAEGENAHIEEKDELVADANGRSFRF